MTDVREPDDVARAALDATVATTLRVLRGAVVALLVIFLGSGAFTVGEHEVAFVRRFGRVVGGSDEERVLRRGIHWSWPALDEVVKVTVARSEAVEATIFSLAPSNDLRLKDQPPDRTGGLDPSRDGYVVTGDGNILHLEPRAGWRVRDPLRFVGRVDDANASALVRVLLERATARAAASRGAEALLSDRQREAFADDVRALAQRGLDDADAGLEVTTLDLDLVEPGKRVAPPPQVRNPFLAVQHALVDRKKRESEARSGAAEIRAGGLAEAARARARADATARRISTDAVADEAVFKDRLAEHQRAPRSLEARLLAETLESALGQVDESFLIRRGQGPRLKLDRQPPRAEEGK